MNGAATLELPDDPILLRQIIVQREAQLEQVKREAADRIEALVQQHKAEMAAVLRRFYGPKSEKFDPRQLLIFGIAAAEQIPVGTAGGSCRPICLVLRFPMN